MDTRPTAPGPRPRDAAATRAAITAAARGLFSRHGYEGTTVRAVAAEAGISQGLVTRYFGSKEGLFLAATATALDVAGVLDGPRESFGARLADRIVSRWRLQPEDDPLLILLRAAASRAEAAHALAAFLARESTAPLLAQLGAYGLPPDEAARRTRAIEAVIMGTVAGQRMLGQAAGAPPEGDALRSWLAWCLQALLDHPEPPKEVTSAP